VTYFILEIPLPACRHLQVLASGPASSKLKSSSWVAPRRLREDAWVEGQVSRLPLWAAGHRHPPSQLDTFQHHALLLKPLLPGTSPRDLTVIPGEGWQDVLPAGGDTARSPTQSKTDLSNGPRRQGTPPSPWQKHLPVWTENQMTSVFSLNENCSFWPALSGLTRMPQFHQQSPFPPTVLEKCLTLTAAGSNVARSVQCHERGSLRGSQVSLPLLC